MAVRTINGAIVFLSVFLLKPFIILSANGIVSNTNKLNKLPNLVKAKTIFNIYIMLIPIANDLIAHSLPTNIAYVLLPETLSFSKSLILFARSIAPIIRNSGSETIIISRLIYSVWK